MVNVLQKLFKLNLGASGGGLSQEEWTLAKQAANNPDLILTVPSNSPEIVLKRENDYLAKYDEIVADRAQVTEGNKERMDRKCGAQQQILEKESEAERAEEQKQNLAFVENLQAEERAKLAQEEQRKAEQDKKDMIVMQLVQSGNLEFDMARSLLDAYNWDLSACKNHLEQTQSIKLTLKNSEHTHGMQGQIERTFKLTEDGTSMVVALNQAFPQTDKCFNLYKDQACGDNIGYMALTGKLQDLRLNAGQVVWYKIENEQKF